jgi:hypothetical protein
LVDDARFRTKDWLDTYLLNANLTKDDDVTQVVFIVAFGYPDYPLSRVFFDPKNVDLVYAVLKARSRPLFGASTTPWGYEETVPIDIRCVSKEFITGTKLMDKGEIELRRAAEANPLGSRRALSDGRDVTEMLSTPIYGVQVDMSYRRNLT